MQDLELKDCQITTLGKPTIGFVSAENELRTYINEDNRILYLNHEKDVRQALKQKKELASFELAGPREKIFFDPKKTKIGIVTCGGLCPGLNAIIRAIVYTAYNYYGITEVYGYCNGYQGLNPAYKHKPLKLTQENVDYIIDIGGTILGSSRGPQDEKVMVDYLVKEKVNILFTVGGDGTLRGAHAIAAELKRRKLNISVVGIPKTIDNDIMVIERSFGFETAVEEAKKAILSAHAEAKGAPNGIGLVKLMGRESGFIASYASLAAPVVNFCLIPEVPFALPKFLTALQKRLTLKDHAVIVVAEGAGQELFTEQNSARDASGNAKLNDIGLFLKTAIKEHFKKLAKEINIKYIDPSYLIRSVPPTADDSAFCLMLGQNALHVAMTGKTDLMVGYWNSHYVSIPLATAVRTRKKVVPTGRLWNTVVEATGQRGF